MGEHETFVLVTTKYSSQPQHELTVPSRPRQTRNVINLFCLLVLKKEEERMRQKRQRRETERPRDRGQMRVHLQCPKSQDGLWGGPSFPLPLPPPAPIHYECPALCVTAWAACTTSFLLSSGPGTYDNSPFPIFHRIWPTVIFQTSGVGDSWRERLTHRLLESQHLNISSLYNCISFFFLPIKPGGLEATDLQS